MGVTLRGAHSLALPFGIQLDDVVAGGEENAQGVGVAMAKCGMAVPGGGGSAVAHVVGVAAKADGAHRAVKVGPRAIMGGGGRGGRLGGGGSGGSGGDKGFGSEDLHRAKEVLSTRRPGEAGGEKPSRERTQRPHASADARRTNERTSEREIFKGDAVNREETIEVATPAFKVNATSRQTP